MTMRLGLIFAAVTVASAGVSAQERVAPKVDDAEASADEPAKSCTARKFETMVVVTVDGEKRGRKVTLCGKENQSDSDWVRTLRDAASKTQASETMRPVVKEQIIAALSAEIAKVEAAQPAVIAPGIALAPVAPLTEPTEREPEYSILPPIPVPTRMAARPSRPTVEPQSSTPPLEGTSTLPPLEGTSTLPPIPEEVRVATNSAAAASAPAPRKPRLTVRCLAPGERGGGSSCDFLEPGTRLAIRAEEDMESAAVLRFVRRGDVRGEVPMAQLRQGQSMRTALPSQLCTGVAKTKVEIQIVGGRSQVLDTIGPYGLRC